MDKDRDKDLETGASEDVAAINPAPAPAVQAPADLAAAYEKVSPKSRSFTSATFS